MTYRLIKAKRIGALEKDVNKLAREGWELVGITAHHYGFGGLRPTYVAVLRMLGEGNS